MRQVFECLIYQHDLRLVALAGCLCVLASFTTVTLLARAAARRDGAALMWNAAAAMIFGCGVWSLHFVAMLAFMPGMAVAYDIQTTLLSIVLAVGGALAAFLIRKVSRGSSSGMLAAGAMLGLAVGAMHYCGVAAMRATLPMTVDHWQVGASLFVGVVFAWLAVNRGGDLATLRRRLEMSGLLALSICGTHFTGMAALDFMPMPGGEQLPDAAATTGAVFASGTLALIVGCVSIVILVASLAAALVEQHLSQRSMLELHRMRRLNDLCREVMIICRDGVIVEINSAGSRLFGARVEELVGRRLINLFPDSDRALVLRETSSAQSNRAAVQAQRPEPRLADRPGRDVVQPDRLRGQARDRGGAERPIRAPARRGTHPLPRASRQPHRPAEPLPAAGAPGARARHQRAHGRQRGPASTSISTGSSRSTTVSGTPRATSS